MTLFRLRIVGPPYVWHIIASEGYEITAACGVREGKKAAIVSPVASREGSWIPEMCGECRRMAEKGRREDGG